MNAKEYLSQARYLDMRINAKLAQLEALQAMMLKAGGVTGRIAAMQEEISRDIDRLADLKQEIAQRIRQLSKPEHQTLMELRYLCGWSWEKIAMNTHYSLQNVYKLHAAAIREICRFCPGVEERREK